MPALSTGIGNARTLHGCSRGGCGFVFAGTPSRPAGGDISFGNLVNFGNIVIEQNMSSSMQSYGDENIALQVGVAVGSNATVANFGGLQTTSFSSIASDPLDHLLGPQTLLAAPPPGAPPHAA